MLKSASRCPLFVSVCCFFMKLDINLLNVNLQALVCTHGRPLTFSGHEGSDLHVHVQ